MFVRIMISICCTMFAACGAHEGDDNTPSDPGVKANFTEK